jgi:thioredoxin reductase/bacterioferritin-associated ferredoxin
MSTTHAPEVWDVVIIGAGPAGMSAALQAHALGLKTVVLDEQPTPGGQIYRNVDHAMPQVLTLAGADYRAGQTLTQALRDSGVPVMHGTLVWDVSKDLLVSAQRDGRSLQLQARQLIAATGAMERACALPGWTLPGVMNAGAAQIALKTAASIPSGRVVLAGAGPLLYLVAVQLLDAGADVRAVVETSPRANAWQALAHLPRALRNAPELVKGLKLMARLQRAGLVWARHASHLQVLGTQRTEGLSYTVGQRSHRLDADMVLLHHGVVPDTQLSRLLRVDHHWDATQLAWHPTRDDWAATSLPGFRIAGDGAAIGGAHVAALQGRLAALGAATALGVLTIAQRDRLAKPLQAQSRRAASMRPFLDALYRPPPWLLLPSDDTVVCRCEEVTAGQVRQMADLGCTGPNQTKFMSRCGMGPCQGRVCGNTVTQLLAQRLNTSPQAVGAYRIRAPLKPISLASYATLGDQPD